MEDIQNEIKVDRFLPTEMGFVNFCHFKLCCLDFFIYKKYKTLQFFGFYISLLTIIVQQKSNFVINGESRF